MDKYAAAWHIQWIEGTLTGKHPKSIAGYIQSLKLRFEDKDAKDEAYASLEKVRYEGCIRDMFTQIQMYNDKAMVSGAALKKLILDRLPHKILEQMGTIDLPGKTDEEIISIITNARRPAEKWDEAKKNLGLRKSISDIRQSKPAEIPKNQFNKPREYKKKFQNRNDRSDQSQQKNFKMKNKSIKTYAEQVEGMEKTELDRRKSAGVCQRCAWPADQKGAHKTMDCSRWARNEQGTAPFPKAKEYHKLEVGAHDQEESDIDLYTTDEDSNEGSEDWEIEEEEEQGCFEEEDEKIEEPEEQTERNSWDSDSDSDYKATLSYRSKLMF